MKPTKIAALAAALAAAMLLGACGTNGESTVTIVDDAPTSMASASSASTALPDAASSAASVASHAEGLAGAGHDMTALDVGREPTTELQVLIEGDIEYVPATLYIGTDYSIYVPDEGWSYVPADASAPVAAEHWQSLNNPDVYFSVWKSQETPEAAGAALTEEGFAAEDTATYSRTQGGNIQVIRLAQNGGEGPVWYLECSYPEEAVEGFGARLPVILESFAFN